MLRFFYIRKPYMVQQVLCVSKPSCQIKAWPQGGDGERVPSKSSLQADAPSFLLSSSLTSVFVVVVCSLSKQAVSPNLKPQLRPIRRCCGG